MMVNAASKRVAIIINGDTEERHLANVDRSLSVLEAKGYTTCVASTSRPKEQHDFYTNAASKDIEAMLKDLRDKGVIDENTELVIYTTGHGDSVDGTGTLCLKDTCGKDNRIAELLDKLPYFRRTVIQDQCYNGNWKTRWVDDPRTLFVSAGNKGETVCCNNFAPHFWAKDVPDLNKDGAISWQERYAYTVEAGKKGGDIPQHIATEGYVQEGERSFGGDVVYVKNEADFDAQLQSLKPGQHAVIMFSTEYCPHCNDYEPKFKKFAGDDNGQHLFIHVKDDNVAARYNIEGFPTIMLVDSKGVRYEVPGDDRNNLPAHYPRIEMDREQRLAIWRKKWEEIQPHLQPFDRRHADPDDIAEYVAMAPKDINAFETAEMAANIRPLVNNGWLNTEVVEQYGRLAAGFDSATLRREADALVLAYRDDDVKLINDTPIDNRRSFELFHEHIAPRLSAEERQKYYQRFIDMMSKDGIYLADAYHGLGNAMREQGLADLSLESLNKAAQQAETKDTAYPYNARALSNIYISRAKTLLALKRNEEANADLDKAALLAREKVKNPPSFVADILFERGMAKAAQNDHCAAIRDLEEAVNLDSNNIRTNLELAKLYDRIGNKEKAYSFYHTASALFASAARALGVHRKLTSEGIELYKDIYWNLGLFNMSRGEFKDAESSFGRLTDDGYMKCADTYYYHGCCLLKIMGRREEGLKYLKAAEGYALKNDLIDKDIKGKIFFELGKYYLASGEKRTGLNYLSMAIKEDPGNRTYANTFSTAADIYINK